jgi:hypothetical protein
MTTTKSMTLYKVFRLTDDGQQQILCETYNEAEADIQFEFYSESKYPHAFVDIEEVTTN